jgi:hypothetical protein
MTYHPKQEGRARFHFRCNRDDTRIITSSNIIVQFCGDARPEIAPNTGCSSAGKECNLDLESCTRLGSRDHNYYLQHESRTLTSVHVDETVVTCRFSTKERQRRDSCGLLGWVVVGVETANISAAVTAAAERSCTQRQFGCVDCVTRIHRQRPASQPGK